MIQVPKSQIDKQIDDLRKKIGSGSGTGKWLDDDHTSVAHNDWDNNTSQGKYDSVDGYDNQLTGTSTISQSDYVSNGTNTVTGQHNRLADCTSNVVSGEYNNLSQVYDSVVAGEHNTATGGIVSSIICGARNTILGWLYRVLVVGNNNEVSATDSIVCGQGNKATNAHSITCGQCANNTGYMIAVGNGSSANARSNSFTTDYAGNVRAAGTITPGGADYAEYFEWLDGNPENEDRRGMLVTLDGDKIVPAHGNEFIGVISANPSVIGNSAEMHWHGKYKTDVFGQVLKDEAGKPIISDEYKKQRYIPRSERPEWGLVGLVGRLVVADDGSCKVGGCVSARNGIGTSCYKGNARVLRRLDENHIEILLR